MPEGCSNHSRDGSSCFEEDDSLVKPIGSAHDANSGIIELTASHCVGSMEYPPSRNCWRVIEELGGICFCLYRETKSNPHLHADAAKSV